MTSTRALTALFLAATALAGCEAQPIGSYDNASFAASRAAGPYTLYFQPDSDSLATGEAQRLSSYLKTLAPRAGQDILLEVGNSGNVTLDARRLMTLRRTFAGSQARVRVTVPKKAYDPGAALSNAVQVSLVRYDLITVTCPDAAQPMELSTPLPPLLGCSNAVNRATMAAEVRDLVAPANELEGSQAGAAADAVQRYRAGKVRILPINVNGG